MIKSVCFIPARGGSKRIPNKNMRPFLGTPILKRVIDTALLWGNFDRVVVSSDSDDILSKSAEWGALAERRPAELCGDDVWLEPVLADYIRRNDGLDWVCMILPTAVFLTPDIIGQCFEWRGELPVVTDMAGTGKDAGHLYLVEPNCFLQIWSDETELRDYCIRYPIKAIDINTEEDWKEAERIYMEIKR